jgi:acyl-CoA thioester hydrolase
MARTDDPAGTAEVGGAGGGGLGGGGFRMAFRIHYADTDAGGIVYHARYLEMAERCRAELLRALGLPLIEADGAGFVARSAQVDWLRPARLDDLLLCTTLPVELGGASLRLSHVFTGGGTELARIEILLAHITAQGRPRRLPEALRAAFARLAAS